MKRNTLITIGVIVGLVVIIIIWIININNGMVNRNQAVKNTWAKVESQYQRRMDLYESEINTIKGSADFEQKTLTQVIAARSGANMKLDPDKFTADDLQKYQAAQAQYKTAFNLVVEQYPQIKTTEQFMQFEQQEEGTENRINKARNDFNDAVIDYNTFSQRFPNSIFLGGRYPEKAYFQADEGASKNPKIDFSSGSQK